MVFKLCCELHCMNIWSQSDYSCYEEVAAVLRRKILIEEIVFLEEIALFAWASQLIKNFWINNFDVEQYCLMNAIQRTHNSA